MNRSKTAKDPWHDDGRPVQEYEDRRSITKDQYDNELYLQDVKWEDLQQDETEEYKDLYLAEKRRVRELENQIEREMR